MWAPTLTLARLAALRDQTLGFNVAAIKEYLDAYNRNGVHRPARTLSRKFFG